VDSGEPSYQTYRKAQALHMIIIPLVLLVIVVALVSGLVLGGVIQGHQERMGPALPPTTGSTVLIVP
jgi:hypothetical protein